MADESQSSASDHLQQLLDRSAALREAGHEINAIAMGPQILRAYYEVEQGRRHPRDNPRTISDKIYCRILDTHDNGGCEVFSRLSDKLAVREWVAGRIDERYLTPLLWSGDDAREIPWDRLPAEFVLKCNEGSGKGSRLDSGCDREEVIATASKWQADSFYWRRREFHYWDVPRRLLIEPVLDDGHPDGPIDYIFFCFDGVPRLLQVGSRSHTIHRFFLPDWSPLTLTYREKYETPEIARPAQLGRMLELAADLSSGFDFVRVDLYCCGDDIRFGEMTFTPCAGRLKFEPVEWNERVGDWWRYAGLPDG